jgi:hypothetical protein
MVEMEGTRLQ